MEAILWVLNNVEGYLMLHDDEGYLTLTDGENSLILTDGEGYLMLNDGEGYLMLNDGKGYLMLTDGKGYLILNVREGFLKPVLNWANVCSPNILRTLRRTMIHFLIELLVLRIWFRQSKLYFILRRAADSMIENVG